jgi:proteasome lid subunit RPN8/RPN11
VVYTRGVLRLPPDAAVEVVGHAVACLPEEACGLLVGSAATGEVARFVPCRNTAASSRVYAIDGRDLLRTERAAEDEGLEVIGVVHSHTHTEAYPSPTDVAQAPDPTWHYVIVSLKREDPSTRSYRIVDGTIAEEPIEVLGS